MEKLSTINDNAIGLTNIQHAIREVIQDWWNDTCRKNWRWDFNDPSRRTELLDELADNILDKIS